MITRVSVRNFRSLAEVDVVLGSLTVLVGRNGAGKSAFLDVLRFVSEALRFGLDTAITDRHGVTVLRRWGPRRPYDIEIRVAVQDEKFRGEYSFIIGSENRGEYRVKGESCIVDHQGTETRFEVKEGKWVTLPDGIRDDFRLDAADPDHQGLALRIMGYLNTGFYWMFDELTHLRFYSIYPNTLREPQKPLNESRLLERGENLASVLREFKRGKNRWLPDLKFVLSRAIDGVNDVQVRQVGGFLVTELQHADEQDEKGRAHWFELAQESDGTLRILGLLVALYQDPPPPFIAIEEPELTLHPGALAIISDVLREAVGRCQVLITTQSPDLISHFPPEELRVVERRSGMTTISPVSGRQIDIVNKQLFTTGDLLRIEGLHGESNTP